MIADFLTDKAKVAAAATSVALDADLILYNAGVTRKNQAKLLRLLESRENRSPNVLLFLLTEGGDPNAAYKISRLLQEWYEKFICLLPGYCKSAGTMILMGAYELIITDDGELGPVDIQMSKKDELAQYQSGLTVLSALTALHEKAYLAWEYFFLQLESNAEGTITLKTAANIATGLTTGLFSPVYQQIDPLHLGEATRAMAIGTEYGKRLNRKHKNLRPGQLESLVAKYSDHGFVIDRVEAENLFYRVRRATADENALSHEIERYCDVEVGRRNPIIEFLSEQRAAVATPAAPAPEGGTHVGHGDGDRPGPATAGIGTNETPAIAGAGVPQNGH